MQGVVVYITSEGISGVKRRLVGMRRHHEVEGKPIPFALIPAMPDLGTKGDDLKTLIEDITAKVKNLKVPVRLIVIDTLRAAIPGKSENDPKDMSTFVDNCKAIAKIFGCHVHFAHHTPRSADDRGSGTNYIDGALDVLLTVARADNGSTPRATVTVKAMKDGEDGASVMIELHNVEVGLDRNKQPKHGAYVTVTAAARVETTTPTKKPPKLPASAKNALTALANALAEIGRAPPASTIIPPSIKKVVTIEEWRQYAYRQGISKGDTERARQRAFERAGEHLQSIGRIGVLDDNVWIVPRETPA
jgi:hypothetical protein